jgi:cellulose synthase/poly-beta-1,6-N-acetylglucosamine synthase-like glycosyltransferase
LTEKINLKIMIVIPVYNHPNTVRNVVTRALEIHDRVMVVDDGSADTAADLLTGLKTWAMVRRSGPGLWRPADWE